MEDKIKQLNTEIVELILERDKALLRLKQQSKELRKLRGLTYQLFYNRLQRRYEKLGKLLMEVNPVE